MRHSNCAIQTYFYIQPSYHLHWWTYGVRKHWITNNTATYSSRLLQALCPQYSSAQTLPWDETSVYNPLIFRSLSVWAWSQNERGITSGEFHVKALNSYVRILARRVKSTSSDVECARVLLPRFSVCAWRKVPAWASFKDGTQVQWPWDNTRKVCNYTIIRVIIEIPCVWEKLYGL